MERCQERSTSVGEGGVKGTVAEFGVCWWRRDRLSEHVCSDGHPDGGDGTDCPNCVTQGGHTSWNGEIARANTDGRWDTWGGDGVGP